MSRRRSAPITRILDDDHEPHERSLSLRLVRRLFEYTRPYARKRNMLLTAVVIRSIQLPTLAAIIKAVIDGPITNGDARGTLLGILGLTAMALFTEITLHFRHRWAMELGEWVVHDLRRDLFNHIQRLTLGYFDKTKHGRLISRMTSDSEAVRMGVQNVLFVTMVQVGQGLVACVFMARYNFRLFLVVLLAAPIIYAIVMHFRARLSKAYRALQASFSRVTATLAESVSGIRVTQGFVREGVNAELFDDLLMDHAGYNMEVAQTAGRFLPMLDFSSRVFMAVVLLVGGYLALKTGVDVDTGDLIGFFLMVPLFFGPIAVLGFMYNNALRSMAGAERVFGLLDTEPEWDDPAGAKPLQRIEGRVEFQNVCFEYEQGKPVLKNVSFSAEEGQTIAIVGETGSGKTTIVNLLAKFYPVTEGRILIDGIDTAHVETDSLRTQLGIVLQQNFLFTGTVLNNIRIGRQDASDEDVRNAAEALDCLDLLEGMPDGLETKIGEGGTLISLGQRQLICFTRAMLADPRILLLDEATSSVDTITEARVQKALVRLLKNRTSFVVAHRLSTIRHADCVLVLKDGRIEERGTHLELLTQGGLYTSLYRKFLRSAGS